MPASYPTSVKTFAARNTGDVIQAAHVGDLQDEVNAIEDGLINGVAHLQSSNSTVNALSVSSNSTFTYRPVMPPPDAALVVLQSTAALGSSVTSTLAFLSADFKTNSSLHSTATNPERLTPQSTGVYWFGANIAVAGITSTVSIRDVLIQDSSGTTISETRLLSDSNNAFNLTASGIKRYDVTGGFAVVLFKTSGNSTTSLSSGLVTSFSIYKL